MAASRGTASADAVKERMANILVADDEEGLRSFLSEALELDGHTVVAASDGGAALREAQRRSFDVLVTDLSMPVMDGMELLRRLRSEQPELEIIVLTAHGAVETAVEAMKLGAFDYLRKPLSGPTELRLLVSRALERRALLAGRERSKRDDGEQTPLTWGDPAMAPVVDSLRKVARTDATVLLVGESGVGKEVAARFVHTQGLRASGPFVAVNCAALADTLLESELFGHEKGAFTGASALRRGRIELAEGGTFFLDEVGELKQELQAKLLRVLQERRFERVGGGRTLEANVRWVAATNRDLHAEIAKGRFREDLYHRLAVFPVELPPLRERRSDIPPLAETLLGRIARNLGRPSLRLDARALAVIADARWPGNVRELANALERAAILADGDVIGPEHLPLASSHASTPSAHRGAPRSLEEMEKEAIADALASVNGNRRLAAEKLGIGLRTLYDKLKRYNLE